MTAWIWAGKAECDLALTLKNAVMEAILRQDLEYFDKHKVGVLQERLNADTKELSGNALSVPASIIQNATFVLTNTYILWQKSHALTLIGSAILPLVALGQYYLVEFYRTLARKQSKYREMSSASTTETLSEIRTVREHAMEPQGFGGDGAGGVSSDGSFPFLSSF
jgi:ABC-type multidrug transport system fused ATPase/permease subunit